MKVNKTVLDNGVRILTRDIPHVHSVSMGVWVNVGARDETPSENGLSHLIEHMIFKGTARRNAFDIARVFDAIGGQGNAFTSIENTCYHARVMDAHLETMVDILSDIFLNSVFDPDELERERTVILQEIDMIEDSPEELIHVFAEQNFWGDHPLGQPVIGSRENVRRFDAGMLREFFHRFYQPDRIIISAAGKLEHDRIVDAIGPAFRAVDSGNGIPGRTIPAPRSGVFLHARDTAQAHLCLLTGGFAATDPRRYAASLLNTILGGNMSSRLFQEIRERKGLAYSVYSFLNTYGDTGMAGVYVGTAPDQTPECTAAILKELDILRTTTVDEEALKDAREYVKACLLLSAESVDTQMVRLAQNELLLGRVMAMEEVVRRLEAVTGDDIRELAREMFQSERMALTVLGPVADPDPFETLLAAF